MLLLKPTIALPFVVLLLVRREWKACGVVAICAVVWYLGSVAASAGDWNWIPPYLAIVHSLYNTDLGALYNGITLPMILVRLGTAPSIALALGTIVFVGFLPALSRANNRQALSFTSLLSLALSAHAWMYEAGLALPALFYAMANVAEPWRTRLIVGAYVLAALWMPIDALIWFNPLAIITLGGIILCGLALYGKGSISGKEGRLHESQRARRRMPHLGALGHMRRSQRRSLVVNAAAGRRAGRYAAIAAPPL